MCTNNKNNKKHKREKVRKKRLRAVEMGGRLFIGRDSNVGAGDRPHATVNAHKTLCALGAVARPNVILFFFKIFLFTLGRSTAPTRHEMRTNLCAKWGRVTAPTWFYFFLNFFIRVGAVGQGSYSVNLSAPTQRCHVKIAGGKFDRRSDMGAVRTAPTLGKYLPQICPFFVVQVDK